MKKLAWEMLSATEQAAHKAEVRKKVDAMNAAQKADVARRQRDQAARDAEHIAYWSKWRQDLEIYKADHVARQLEDAIEAHQTDLRGPLWVDMDLMDNEDDESDDFEAIRGPNRQQRRASRKSRTGRGTRPDRTRR